MPEGQPGIREDNPADFHYEPATSAAEMVTQTQEKSDPNFILYEARRKLNFAKSLLEQYEIDKTELVADLNTLEDASSDRPHIENTIKFLEEQTARIEKLIALENQLNEPNNENQTIITATEIANTVFPYETNHYSDDALSKKLETMQDRLDYLTQAETIQIPLLNKPGSNTPDFDTNKIYAWKSEIRDLKNHIPQIQAEIARRKLSPLGRPMLRVLTEPSYDAMTIDSGDYQLIDDGDSPTIKLHPLSPRTDAKKNDLTTEEKDYIGLAETESDIPTIKVPPQN